MLEWNKAYGSHLLSKIDGMEKVSMNSLISFSAEDGDGDTGVGYTKMSYGRGVLIAQLHL